MKIWKYSAIIALIETITLAGLVLLAMFRHGDGSGVWIPLIPFLWLALSVRSWVFHKIQTAMMKPISYKYTLVTVAIVVVLGTIYTGGDWYTVFRYGSLTVLSNLIALPIIAALIVRSYQRENGI
jgi:hypothetical protein